MNITPQHIFPNWPVDCYRVRKMRHSGFHMCWLSWRGGDIFTSGVGINKSTELYNRHLVQLSQSNLDLRNNYKKPNNMNWNCNYMIPNVININLYGVTVLCNQTELKWEVLDYVLIMTKIQEKCAKMHGVSVLSCCFQVSLDISSV